VKVVSKGANRDMPRAHGEKAEFQNDISFFEWSSERFERERPFSLHHLAF
jgi:hypothetical protein